MEGPGEEQEQDEKTVVEREDAESAADVESLEEVRDVQGI